jgi:hypothetical protein
VSKRLRFGGCVGDQAHRLGMRRVRRFPARDACEPAGGGDRGDRRRDRLLDAAMDAITRTARN